MHGVCPGFSRAEFTRLRVEDEDLARMLDSEGNVRGPELPRVLEIREPNGNRAWSKPVLSSRLQSRSCSNLRMYDQDSLAQNSGWRTGL